jgi:hypothetical protein
VSVSLVTPNLPVERARGTVGAKVKVGDRAAHRPVGRLRGVVAVLKVDEE